MNSFNTKINENTEEIILKRIIGNITDGEFRLNFFNVFCSFTAWVILFMALCKKFYFPKYRWKIHYLSNKWALQILSQKWSEQVLYFVNRHIRIWSYVWVLLVILAVISYIIISIDEVEPSLENESNNPNVVSIFSLVSVCYKVKKIFVIVVARVGFILCILMYSSRITPLCWYKWVRSYSNTTIVGEARGALSSIIVMYYLYATCMIIKWVLTRKVQTYKRCISEETFSRDYLILSAKNDFYLCVKSYKGVAYYRIFERQQWFNSRKMKKETVYVSPENGFFKQYEDCLRCFDVLANPKRIYRTK